MRRDWSVARAAPLIGAALVLILAANVGVAAGPGIPHPTNVDGPPLGHTGGFDEPTCLECHADFELNPPGGVLGVDGLPANYQPGSRYTVSVLLASGDMGMAGFQGAFRFAAGENEGKQAGRAEPADDRVMVALALPSGIEYVHHTGGGTELADHDLASWSFVWTAPSTGEPVVFHVVANSANADNSPLGDFIYTAEARSNGRE